MSEDQAAIGGKAALSSASMTITSKEEYKNLLSRYPDNPHINRLCADFLKKERYFANAIKRYQKTYGLFMAEDQTLQAIATLFELWEIVKPVPYEFRSLHSQLRRKIAHNSVIAECFAAMSYKELRATLSSLEKIRLKADEIIQTPGDPEEYLCLVIFGDLIKSSAHATGARNDAVQFLTANDHFGSDHLFEESGPARYQVRAASEAELLRISKKNFLGLCETHPDLMTGSKKMVSYQEIPEGEKPEKFSRKTSRRHLTISLSLDILALDPGRDPIRVKGFSSDISLGGACVIVDPKYRDIPADDILNRKTRLLVSLPDESISVSIIGTVAWYKEIEIKGQQTCAIGVKFNETPPRLRASLIIFISSVGSMNTHDTSFNLSQDEIEAW
jgi:CRP-like cAMP-binding protein